MAADCEPIDTYLFIEEVHKSPCLWDYRTEEYSNRIIKNKAWESVCQKFYEDYDHYELNEKMDCATNLQRKWRSLRDSFNRYLKKQSTGAPTKRYYFFNQLKFLLPLAEKRIDTSSLEVENKDDDNQNDEEDKSYNKMFDCENIDTALFIEEIRNLPCLWDYRVEEYSDRILKNKAWEMVCKKFYEDFDDKEADERMECAANLQRKWRSLKDSFNRDLRKQSTGAGSSRRYYYFNQLTFLLPLAEKRINTSSFKVENKDDDNVQIDEEHEEENSIDFVSLPMSDSEIRKRPKMLINKPTSHISDTATAYTQAQKRVDSFKSSDSDMHFLLSLYDRFKNIRDDLKLNAQLEILNVIKKYSNPPSNDTSNNFMYVETDLPQPSGSRFSREVWQIKTEEVNSLE